MIRDWYTLGTYNDIKCMNCRVTQNDIQSMDHHMMICPNCLIECIWYDLGNKRVIQIIPSLAPEVFRSFMQWAQKELDELEFIELFISFEKLGKVIKESKEDEI